jgi:hypothetical protein
VEPMDVYVAAPGDSAFQSVGSADGGVDMRPDVVSPVLVALGSVGKVTVIT